MKKRAMLPGRDTPRPRKGYPRFFSGYAGVRSTAIPTLSSPAPLVLVWHIFSGSSPNVLKIVSRQLSLIVESGLMEALTAIKVGFVGEAVPDDILSLFAPYSKIQTLVTAEKGYEGVTLRALQGWLEGEQAASKEWFILYIHSRGARHAEDSPAWSWTKMMEYFMIERHKDCVEALKTHLTTGCEMYAHYDARTFSKRPWGMWHYSGNFWWARASYIRVLPPIPASAVETFKHEVSEDWILYEANHRFHISKFHVMHHTTRAPYDVPTHSIYHMHYPRSAYEVVYPPAAAAAPPPPAAVAASPPINLNFHAHTLSLRSMGHGLCNLLFGLVSAILRAMLTNTDILIVDDDMSVDFASSHHVAPMREMFEFDEFCARALEISNVRVILRSEIHNHVSCDPGLSVRAASNGFVVEGAGCPKVSGSGPSSCSCIRLGKRNSACLGNSRSASWQVGPGSFYMEWIKHWHQLGVIAQFDALIAAIPLKPLKDSIPPPGGLLSVLHCKNEADSIKHYAKQTGLSLHETERRLNARLVEVVLDNVPAQSQLIVLTARTAHNPVLETLSQRYKVSLLPKGRFREVNAMQDLRFATEFCNHVFIGNFSMANLRGSSFSYVIAKKMCNPGVRFVWLDLDNMGKTHSF